MMAVNERYAHKFKNIGLRKDIIENLSEEVNIIEKIKMGANVKML